MSDGGIVEFEQADLEKRDVVLFDGRIVDLPDNRRVEVWSIKNEDGFCIRIFRPTKDGKTSKLKFGIYTPAAEALCSLLTDALDRQKQNQT